MLKNTDDSSYNLEIVREKLDSEYNYFDAYVPSLNLNEADLHEYHNAHTLNSFIKKFSVKLFEHSAKSSSGLANAGLESGFDMLAGKYKNKSEKMIEHGSKLADIVNSDINQIREQFVLNKNFNQKIDYYRKVAANIDLAEAEGLSHEQVMKYYRLNVDLLPIALKDLKNDCDYKYLAVSEKLENNFIALSQQLNSIDENSANDRNELKTTLLDISNDLSGIEGNLKSVLKNQLASQLSSDATESNLSKISDLLDQFGVDISTLQQNSVENQKTMQHQLAILVTDFEKKQMAQEKQQSFDSARYAMRSIGLLGNIFNQPELVKVGHIGFELVNIVEGVSKLAEMGIAGITSLAVFGPVSVILTATFSIIGLFKKKKNTALQQLMRELRYLRQVLYKMDQKIDHILISLDSIIDMVTDTRHLVFDSTKTLNNAITQNRMTTIVLKIQELQTKLINLLKRDLSYTKDNPEQLSLYADKLETWMFDRSCSGLFGGTINLAGAKDEAYDENITTAFSTFLPVEYTSALLANILKARDPDFPNEIDVGSIFNIDIWLMILSKYTDVVKLLKNHNKERPCIEKIQSMLENQYRFVHYLQQSQSPYRLFYKAYWDSINEFDHLVKCKFSEMKLGKLKELPNTLKTMSTGTQIDRAIYKAATRINAYAKIIRACGEVSGIGLSLPVLMPKLDRNILMTQMRNWNDTICDLNDVIDSNPDKAHFTYCLAQLEFKNRMHTFNIVRDQSILNVKAYNPISKKWEYSEKFKLQELPKGTDDTYIYIESIPIKKGNTTVLNIVIHNYEEAAVYQFDPNNEKALSFLTTHKYKASTTVKVNKLRFDDEERLILTTFNSLLEHHSLSINKDQKNWTSYSTNKHNLPNGSSLSNTINITSNGKEYLYTMIQTSNGRIPVRFDPEEKSPEKAWSKGSTGFSDVLRNQNHQSCISRTIRDQVWNNGGNNKIVSCIHQNDVTKLYAYDPTEDKWQKLENTDFPKINLSKVVGPAHYWAHGIFKSTILKINGAEHFVTLAKVKEGLKLQAYNLEKQAPTAIQEPEIWHNTGKHDPVRFGGALQCIPINISSKHQELMISTKYKNSIQMIHMKVIEPHIPFTAKEQGERIGRQQKLILQNNIVLQNSEKSGDLLPLGPVPMKIMKLNKGFTEIGAELQCQSGFINSIGSIDFETESDEKNDEGYSCILM